MSVPDELRTLYVAAAEMAVLEGVDLGEIDDIALAVVLERYEQMCLAKWLKQLPAENAAQRAEIERQVRAKVAEEIQREADEHSNAGRRSSWDRGMTRAAEIARGES